MTPEEFIAKFPKQASVNREFLEDIACPNCGQRESFNIQFTGTCETTDEGTDDVGDHEWDGTSLTQCNSCVHAGSLSDFTIQGLDDALDEMQQEEEA